MKLIGHAAMVGDIEAAGELATGALLGRAVEPNAGEGHGAGHGMCLNCGTALIGSHCHNCGQAGHVHRSLHAIGHDILHGVFHFEGKLWRTLPMLAWRPGELTRRYIAGERARFVSPMAIFLFSVFAMFAVFSWVGISTPTEMNAGNLKPAAAIDYARKDAQQDLAKAQRKLAQATDEDDKAEYRERIADAQNDLAGFDKAAKALGNGTVKVTASEVHTGWHALDHGIEKWQKNPALMMYKLQSASYKFSWLLIPLSIPFLWALFFWKRQYKLYDHAVFITYSITFMSLFYIVVAVVAAIGLGGAWLALAALAIPFVHITRQLQQAYLLGWFSAIMRAWVLTFFIGWILAIFFLILLALGMFG
ncbi:DUF3667 domain-containing protein [Sphingomonas sp. HITSZ_GF]|uniref:DUF3667 domain-containing protein n=1 Tax=Sphingomonas sp. HITSZ_GF TaxID=3037247 RepID=UPI00240DC03B|nr:DUF3667 domain-containing protein [Sphingomonas sp. HITSZ_GF]MDG2533518.1 DUF3667 domain-containing protein [Sphingomonas sp. HITSZ_GF]